MASSINASATGVGGVITTADASGVLQLQSNGTTSVEVTNSTFKFNSGYGSVATAYGCRAWVNFNGTGTVAIRASGNVTSITDNGTGNYSVNFTTAMIDANYATIATDLSMDSTFLNSVEVIEGTTPSTTSVNLIVCSVRDGGSTYIGRDAPAVYCAIFR